MIYRFEICLCGRCCECTIAPCPDTGAECQTEHHDARREARNCCQHSGHAMPANLLTSSLACTVSPSELHRSAWVPRRDYGPLCHQTHTSETIVPASSVQKMTPLLCKTNSDRACNAPLSNCCASWCASWMSQWLSRLPCTWMPQTIGFAVMDIQAL